MRRNLPRYKSLSMTHEVEIPCLESELQENMLFCNKKLKVEETPLADNYSNYLLNNAKSILNS